MNKKIFIPVLVLILLAVLIFAGSSLIVSQTGQESNASTLVLYLPFDNGNQSEDWSRYGNDGVINGATYNATDGYKGGAFDFNGANNVITSTDNVLLSDATDITVNVFAKFNSFALSYNVPVSSGAYSITNVPQTSGWFFWTIYGGTSITFTVAENTTAYATTPSKAINTDTWYMLTGVFNKATQTASLYVDGAFIGATTNTEVTRFNGSAFTLGNGGYSLYHWLNGTIDEVKIWNRALSAEEIKNLYLTTLKGSINSGNLTKGLIAHYPLSNESLKNLTFTSQLIADTTPYGNDGVILWGASDGFTTDQMGVADRAFDFDGADTTIPTTWTSNSEFQNGFTLSAWIYPESVGETAGRIVDKADIAGDSDNGFGYYVYQDKISIQIDRGGFIGQSGTITYNTWQHVLVTVASDATVTHYINGVVSGTPGDAGALAGITSTNPLTIGNNAGGTDRTFDGSISDVKIFNRVLSTAEIKQLYEQYRPQANTGSLYKGLIFDMPLTSKWMQNASVLSDNSAYHNHGTLIDGVVYDNGTEFDGADTKIDTGSDWIGTQAVSISAWIYADSYGENNCHIIDNGKTVLYLRSGGANHARFYSDGALSGDYAQSGTILLNRWYHIVVTRTIAGLGTFYLNGVFSGGSVATTPITGTTNVIIGNDNAQSQTFNGSISDVKSWNRVLTAQEAKQAFETTCGKRGVC